MLKRILPIIVLVLVFAGCKAGPKANDTTFTIKNGVLHEKAFNTAQPPEIILDIVNCNLTIISHDKDEVKFSIRNEATYVNKSEDSKIVDSKIDIQQIENKIVCKSILEKNDNNNTNINNIIIAIPKSIASMQIKLDEATLVVRDDLRCQVLLEAGICDVKISRLVGSIAAKIIKGNFEVSSGRLSAAECYIENEGNIYIKSELDKNGKYAFETNKGNINLQLPENIKASFESAGIIEVNDFDKQDSEVLVSLKSKLGRITMRKGIF